MKAYLLICIITGIYIYNCIYKSRGIGPPLLSYAEMILRNQRIMPNIILIELHLFQCSRVDYDCRNKFNSQQQVWRCVK